MGHARSPSRGDADRSRTEAMVFTVAIVASGLPPYCLFEVYEPMSNR
jgi:hypothetical protein